MFGKNNNILLIIQLTTTEKAWNLINNLYRFLRVTNAKLTKQNIAHSAASNKTGLNSINLNVLDKCQTLGIPS
jgi:arginine/lysine/ornithine decarboxylase